MPGSIASDKSGSHDESIFSGDTATTANTAIDKANRYQTQLTVISHFRRAHFPRVHMALFIFNLIQLLTLNASPIFDSWGEAEPFVQKLRWVRTFSVDNLRGTQSFGVLVAFLFLVALIVTITIAEGRNVMKYNPHPKVAILVQILLPIASFFFFPILGQTFWMIACGASPTCTDILIQYGDPFSITTFTLAIICFVYLFVLQVMYTFIMFEWNPEHNPYLSSSKIRIWFILDAARIFLSLMEAMFAILTDLDSSIRVSILGFANFLFWGLLCGYLMYYLPFHQWKTNVLVMIIAGIGAAFALCRTLPAYFGGSIYGLYLFIILAIIAGIGAGIAGVVRFRKLVKKFRSVEGNYELLKETCQEYELEILGYQFFTSLSKEAAGLDPGNSLIDNILISSSETALYFYTACTKAYPSWEWIRINEAIYLIAFPERYQLLKAILSRFVFEEEVNSPRRINQMPLAFEARFTEHCIEENRMQKMRLIDDGLEERSVKLKRAFKVLYFHSNVLIFKRFNNNAKRCSELFGITF